MKKINSINYGGKIIGIGLIVMLLIPGILLTLNLVMLAGIFGAIGVLILLGFALLLFIEFRQDKKIDKYYSEHKDSDKTPQEILDMKWKRL